MSNPFEQFWGEVLSREPERIRAAFSSLPEDEKEYVSTHLKRMTEEEGWHPEQITSARAALEALRDA